MNLDAFREQLDALKKVVTGLSNIGQVDEHIFGIHQQFLFETLRDAAATGLSRTQALSESRLIVDLLIQVAQRDNLPLSHELERLIEECEGAGLPLILRTVPLPQSQPLASFPTEPPVTHSVFVDESGSASFSEDAQPVLCLTGVLISDEQIPLFEAAVNGLLDRHNLPRETEIHAQPLLSHEGPLGASTPDERYEFLREFIEIGMRHVVGVHYIGMLKPMVEQPFRERLKSLGMNAYTQNVLYFNLTLQAAAIREIAFAKYRYYFDRTDAYRKDIRRILRALNDEPNRGLRVRGIEGEPIEVDSKQHRFVQLADVLGYFLARHRQIEVRTFPIRDAVKKHEPKILEIYGLITPKLMSFVKDRVFHTIDWKAIQGWGMPQKRRR